MTKQMHEGRYPRFAEGFRLLHTHQTVRMQVAAGGDETLKELIGASIALGVTDEGTLMSEIGKVAGGHHGVNVAELIARHCDGKGEDLWRRLPSGELYVPLS